LIIPNLVGNAAGIALIAGIFLFQRLRNKRDALAAA